MLKTVFWASALALIALTSPASADRVWANYTIPIEAGSQSRIQAYAWATLDRDGGCSTVFVGSNSTAVSGNARRCDGSRFWSIRSCAETPRTTFFGDFRGVIDVIVADCGWWLGLRIEDL